MKYSKANVKKAQRSAQRSPLYYATIDTEQTTGCLAWSYILTSLITICTKD